MAEEEAGEQEVKGEQGEPDELDQEQSEKDVMARDVSKDVLRPLDPQVVVKEEEEEEAGKKKSSTKQLSPFVSVDDLLKQSSLRQSEHDKLQGVPYCSICKVYLTDIKRSDLFLKTGFLFKKKNVLHSRLSRWFVLIPGHLLYYARTEDVASSFPRGLIHLETAIVKDVFRDQCQFLISDGSRQMDLKAATAKEKQDWIALIKFEANKIKSKGMGISKHSDAVIIKPFKDKTAFCDQCGSYFNLDAFTLADHCGYIDKYQSMKRTWKKRWVVVSGGHLAYFESEKASIEIKSF
jgi:hypothetical protein